MQEAFDRQLQMPVGRDADGVAHAACLQRLVDLRPRKGGVSPERDALSLGLLAVDLGHEQFLPVVRAETFPGRSFAAKQSPWSLNRSG